MDKINQDLERAVAAAVPSNRGFDSLIVGAGFAGSVLAERLATVLGQRVLIVDKRPHIGGNAYDRHDDAGVLIHPYGPHIFHTNSEDIFAYLSRFTQWRPYQHRVLASVDGQLVPMPINLDTVNKLYGLSLTAFQMEEFLASVAEKKDQVKTSEDVVSDVVQSRHRRRCPFRFKHLAIAGPVTPAVLARRRQPGNVIIISGERNSSPNPDAEPRFHLGHQCLAIDAQFPCGIHRENQVDFGLDHLAG